MERIPLGEHDAYAIPIANGNLRFRAQSMQEKRENPIV